MIVNAIYKINERYVVGDDRNIYRLPITINKRSYKLKKIKKYRGGYFIDGVWNEKQNIHYEKIEPFELINDEKLPF